MTDTRTLRIKNPVDLIACVPLLLGFHPEESAVLITLDAVGEPLCARVDLPPGPDDVGAVVDDLCTTAGRLGLRSVALVLLTHDDLMARLVHDAFVVGLGSRAIDVVVAVRADGARWFPLSGLRGDPDEGEAYDLTTHPFTLHAMVEGLAVHESRTALGDSLLPTDPDEVERVTAAVDAAADRLRSGARPHLVAEGRWLQQRLRRLTTSDPDGPGDELTVEEAGRVLAALVSSEVRDVAWAEMSRATAPRHVQLWRDLVRRTPLEVLAAPATLLAFAAWLAGDGALAWCALDRARAADPDYPMATLVERALTCAVPPSTWEPLDSRRLSLFARDAGC